MTLDDIWTLVKKNSGRHPDLSGARFLLSPLFCGLFRTYLIDIFLTFKHNHMKAEKKIRHKIVSDIAISIFLYATPVFLMLLSFYLSGARPWQNYIPTDAKVNGDKFIAQVFNHLASWVCLCLW
jgi:hypothetical protein